MVTSEEVKRFLKDTCEAEVVGISPATYFNSLVCKPGNGCRGRRLLLRISPAGGQLPVRPAFQMAGRPRAFRRNYPGSDGSEKFR